MSEADRHERDKSGPDGLLNKILAEYLSRLDRGEAVDREALIAAHPEVAEELRAYFADEDAMHHLASASSPAQPPAEVKEDEPPPRVIRYFGDYELLEVIGRGGMGVVYKARQRSLDRIVAVKMIHPGMLAKPDSVERFHREARAAANLQHPNVVRVFEVGEHEGHHYFSMEYLQGENLAEATRRKTIEPRKAAFYIKKAAEAIEFAHQEGILHRDLKPSNVFVDHRDEPWVMDFGVAKRLAGEQDLTRESQVLGTLQYMSPEQADARKAETGPAADIYGLGATLYHLLAGRAPFMAENDLALLQQVLQAEPVPPAWLNPAVDDAIQAICLKCLEKDPKCRYVSAGQLAEELDRYLGEQPLRHTRPPGMFRKLWRRCRRSPATMALAATVVVLLVIQAVLAVLLVRAARSPVSPPDEVVYTEEDIRMLEQNALQRQEVHRVVLALFKAGTARGSMMNEAEARCGLCDALASLYRAQGKTAAFLQARKAAVEAADDMVRGYVARMEMGASGGDEVAKARLLHSDAQIKLEEAKKEITRQGLDPDALEATTEEVSIPIPTRPEPPPLGIDLELPRTRDKGLLTPVPDLETLPGPRPEVLPPPSLVPGKAGK